MTIVAQLGQIPVRRIFNGQTDELSVLANTPVNSGDTVRPLTSATRFFTQFADPNKNTYTWSPLMPDAQEQFLAEKLAMYVSYSDEEALMHTKNPRIDFGVKFLPQTKGHPLNVTGMKLYAVGALKRSNNLYTAQTAQSLITGTQYGPLIATIAGGFSPLKYILDQATNINPEYKKSMLVARGWYDVNQNISNQLTQTMLGDILAGRKSISEATDAFGTALYESYTK